MEFRWFGQPNPTDANENTAICDLLTKLICFTTTWVDWLKGHLEYVRLQYYKYLKASVLVTARCLFAITVTRHLQSSESITFSILQSTVTPSLSVYCDSIALSLLWLHRSVRLLVSCNELLPGQYHFWDADIFTFSNLLFCLCHCRLPTRLSSSLCLSLSLSLFFASFSFLTNRQILLCHSRCWSTHSVSQRVWSRWLSTYRMLHSSQYNLHLL